MKKFIYLLILSGMSIAMSCNNADNKKVMISDAELLLNKAIEGSGGWQNWEGLDTVKFYKTTKLYLEDGSIEDSTYQLHTYYMHPEMNGEYAYSRGKDQIKINYTNGKITQYINGKMQNLNEADHEKLRLGFLGAQFVMCIPFKLNDPGVKLLLDGESNLNGKKVTVLKASYNTENTNHTQTHDWWHYINPNTGALEGYKVHHPPTNARVANVETTRINGVLFPSYRKTYRVDKEDNRQYLRAEFWYEYL